MSWITRRPRSRLAATARWTVMSAVPAGVAYLVGRAAGWHSQDLGLDAAAAGILFASVADAVLRTRRGGDRRSGPAYQVLPEPAPEVVILVEQDRKIQAIRRYRELNPGIGLKQAKDVIDGLQPGSGNALPN